MLAREFCRSAFSTNPNVAGSMTGTMGGGGTPGGGRARVGRFRRLLLFVFRDGVADGVERAGARRRAGGAARRAGGSDAGRHGGTPRARER